MRDALLRSMALHLEPFARHAPHQTGRLLKAGSHRLEARAVSCETGFTPGEVGHPALTPRKRDFKGCELLAGFLLDFEIC